MTTKKTAFWNGKNLAGESQVGANSLISEGPRTSPTQAKYEVSNDTISAAGLQPSAQSAKEITKEGG
ncbi:hypothetical protein [Sporomusa malonica]|uniref:Uncharacterized protein n=1 Tax=Sporomusa malonica TaxID=112901 RepID=A0A1W2CCD3_9FIRM|nr:hypothetical protein [Sporomusa malonica]SMC82654.1 hypothetical protein SAMN04488500_11079 [Sporomusa malonica]